jgi:tetratricopeptide (TPR) repeat protein
VVISFFGLIIDWLVTRDWRRAALALIPFGLVLIVLVLAVLGGTKNKEQLANEYLAAGEIELQNADEEWEFTLGTSAAVAQDSLGEARYAEALFRRALDLQSNNRRTRFVVGAMLGNRGAIHQALAYMSSIAPETGAGYVQAHAWLANLMLQGQLTEAQLPSLKHHLDLAVKWENAPANLLVAASRFAVAAKDNSRAIDMLRLTAEKAPEFEGDLFRLAIQLNNIHVAEQTAEKALPRLLEKITQGTANADDRINLADMLFYKGELQAARAALEDGLKVDGLTPEDTAKLKRALSELYRLRFAQTLKITNESWSADIRLLDRALRADPTNPKVAEQVAMLARVGGNVPPDELIQQLNTFLAEGTATPVTHAWIAEAHILREEYDDAIKHLEDVVARMPDAAQSQNNLAYAIALQFPERMEEALTHAMAAVKAGPRVADFHDTLGFILMQLDRTAEAISEMELAVELQQGRPDFHQRLADAYEKQGNPDMVEIHRQIAAKYSAAIATPPDEPK